MSRSMTSNTSCGRSSSKTADIVAEVVVKIPWIVAEVVVEIEDIVVKVVLKIAELLLVVK